MAKNFYKKIFVFLMLCFLCGCSNNNPNTSATNKKIDVQAIARSIVLCQTTEADLRRQLGEPTRDGILRKDRIVSWITSMDSHVKYLAVFVDNQGVIVDLYWDIPTEIPWTPTNQCINK